MKSKIALILFLVGTILSSCTEIWQMEQMQSDIFQVDLPIGTTEVTKDTNDYLYYIEYKTPAPYDQSIYIKAFPWLKAPKEAMDIVGKRFMSLLGINHGNIIDFDYNTINGVKYEGEDKLLKGEVFCFNKNGYTVVVYSYGRRTDYRTIRDIVRSINFTVPPLTKKQKKIAFSPFNIASILSKQMKQALNTGRGGSHLCDSTSWYLILDTTDRPAPPEVHIRCWLSTQALKLLDPINEGSYSFKHSLATPFYSLNIPIAESIMMGESGLFSLKFDYLDTYGRNIGLE